MAASARKAMFSPALDSATMTCAAWSNRRLMLRRRECWESAGRTQSCCAQSTTRPAAPHRSYFPTPSRSLATRLRCYSPSGCTLTAFRLLLGPLLGTLLGPLLGTLLGPLLGTLLGTLLLRPLLGPLLGTLLRTLLLRPLLGPLLGLQAKSRAWTSWSATASSPTSSPSSASTRGTRCVPSTPHATGAA